MKTLRPSCSARVAILSKKLLLNFFLLPKTVELMYIIVKRRYFHLKTVGSVGVFIHQSHPLNSSGTINPLSFLIYALNATRLFSKMHFHPQPWKVCFLLIICIK